MPAIRMNYTGRIDIQSEEVSATYREESGVCTLVVKWLLGHHGLNPGCHLYLGLEGDGTSESRRFALGLLGDGQGEQTLRLTQVRNPELIKIRLKVVENDSSGIPIIKAQGDKISPQSLNSSNQSRSFLKILKTPELTVPWRVDFAEDEPVLQISDKEELFHKLRDTSPIFMPLVLPEVVRQIFVWLATTEVDYNNEVLKEWVLLFEQLTCPRGFIQQDHSSSDADDFEEVKRVASFVSEEFAKKFDFIQRISSAFESEETRLNG